MKAQSKAGRHTLSLAAWMDLSRSYQMCVLLCVDPKPVANCSNMWRMRSIISIWLSWPLRQTLPFCKSRCKPWGQGPQKCCIMLHFPHILQCSEFALVKISFLHWDLDRWLGICTGLDSIYCISDSPEEHACKLHPTVYNSVPSCFPTSKRCGEKRVRSRDLVSEHWRERQPKSSCLWSLCGHASSSLWSRFWASSRTRFWISSLSDTTDLHPD